MPDDPGSEVKEDQSVLLPNQPAPLDIPSIAKSLREVYRTGSIPLVLIFIAAVVIFGLLAKGILQTLPSLIYFLGFLVASGVAVFLIVNWLAYRQWQDEVKTRLENRRLEMDLYVRLSTSNSELQDKLLLNLLKYTGDLATRSDSTPEGRRAEMKSLTESLGPLVKEFIALRGQLQLPKLTSAVPSRIK